MAEELPEVEISRTDVMFMLHGQGHTRVDMIPVLWRLGLLTHHDSHRMRQGREEGAKVCETCENILTHTWKRYCKSLGATAADLDEIRGAWLNDHETVREICLKNFATEIVYTTVRTEGEASISTTRSERRINVPLLRLYIDVCDKIARMHGVRVDKTANRTRIPRKLLALYTKQVTDGVDEPAN